MLLCVLTHFPRMPFDTRHEKKIVRSKIDEHGEFGHYDDPMICNLCYRCSNLNVCLTLMRDTSSVKCYMDPFVSLTFSENEPASMEPYRAILNEKLALNEGIPHESMIAQTIPASRKQLFFYTYYSGERSTMIDSP